jgi:ribosome-associated heat shock protein Hsp15
MRVDKWLWTARLFKTRGLAAEAIKGGRVHVNGVAVKPGRELVPGDELELALGLDRRVVVVRGTAERRVSAAEVSNLYDETEASVAERERKAELRRLAGPVNLGGRPTKRDRRRFDAGRR